MGLTATVVGVGLLALTTTPAGAQDAAPEGWQSPVAAVTATKLPGMVTDLAMADEDTAYASLGNGQVVRLELPADPAAPIEPIVVLDGLVNPKGIAVRDGVLYVVELGPWPCEDPVGLCEGPMLDKEHPEQGELTILAAMRARVVARDVLEDGTLGPGREVLTDVPVVNAYHSVNGLTLGPDGELYLAVGNIDRLWYAPELLTGTPHPEWLGTVLRLSPDGDPPTIVASGLRNVYEVTFDGTGRMWAVDNDGPTRPGYRFEEVLQLQEGHDYGYPQAGTFLGPRAREDGPVWITDTVGSAGLAWAPDAGLDPGLIIGDCQGLTLLTRAGVAEDRWERALNPGDERPIGGSGACVVTIEPIGGGEVLAAGRGPDGRGLLYRVRFTPTTVPAG